jgi:7-cyano-7-deazaguanine synthase
MRMKKAVVLLSGGLDSTTALAAARSEGFEVYALSFDYGQRHKIELDMARRSAQKLGAKKHLVINIDLQDIGSSALTDTKRSVEAGKRGSGEVKTTAAKKESIPVTYVPARNTIFLSFALAWAETLGVGDIIIGANAVDYSGYPDCRPEYIKAFEDMANLATKVSVEGNVKFGIHAPLINLTKAEIIKKGAELGVDYSLTWSCYDPKLEQRTKSKDQRSQNLPTGQAGTEHRSYAPCGKCDSCMFRAKGFREAGINDPLLLKVDC